MPTIPDTPYGASQTAHPAAPTVELSLGLVTDVQDALMMAMTDLKRLEGLLDHATGNLLERFGSANQALSQLAGHDSDALRHIRRDLQLAVTELQFHDMATQLIGHTGKVLQGCAWKLADDAMAPEEDELPIDIDLIPERPSPVTQSEMEAGSIDLF